MILRSFVLLSKILYVELCLNGPNQVLRGGGAFSEPGGRNTLTHTYTHTQVYVRDNVQNTGHYREISPDRANQTLT